MPPPKQKTIQYKANFVQQYNIVQYSTVKHTQYVHMKNPRLAR